MPKLNWNSNDFRNPQDSSGTVADNISRSGNLQQGYSHGSLTEGLVAYYPMSSGEGSTLIDEALDNDGTINGASWSTDSRIGEACLSFDGSDDHVEAPDSASLDITGSELTMSAWIYLDSVPSNNKDMILNKENEYEMAVGTSGTVEWAIRRGGNWSWIDSGVSVPTGSSTLVSMVYTGSEVRIYKNGILGDTYSLTGNIDSNSKPFTIGWRSSDGESPWNGKIDDVRVYDRSLSTPEIKALSDFGQVSMISPSDTLK